VPVPADGETRSVVALLSAVFASSTAMALLSTVLGKLVFDITGSELALGLLGLAEFAPALVLVFVTGPLADRMDRRRLAAIALGLEALVLAGLTVYVSTDPTSTLPIFLLVIGYGTARAFATPATRSLPADTVVGARLPWLTARQALTWQSALILGPVLGGFLYVVAPWVPFAVAAGLVGIGAVTVLTVRVLPLERAARPEKVEGERTGMHDAMEGLRFVRSRPILLGAISLDLFAVLLGGVTALLPIYARDVLEAGPWALGVLRSAPAVGALATSLILARRAIGGGAGHIMFAAVGVFGLASLAFGLSTSVVLSFLALMVYGASDAISVVIRQSLVQMRTPHDMLGRVLAVNSMFTGSSGSLGEFRAGAVAAALGAVPSALIGGLGTIAVMLIWMWAFPQLRRVDKLAPDESPAL
jgi:MFS family permease